MDPSERVRGIYEKHPYPASLGAPSAGLWWQLAPMEWINSVWQSERPSPRRILVAGCGTGLEAFALRRRFPGAEIVAVDFSPRSIAAARDAQEASRRARRIRFLVADLADRRFASLAGGGFDFVSCHGVLSYIAQPGRALRNLARCLKLHGAIYLGVNGAGHFSVGARPFLSALGFDMAELRDGQRLWQALQLGDAILGRAGVSLAKRRPGYLASDLFGPLIHDWPLADWIGVCREAGLHLLGSYETLRSLRPALNSDLYRLLMPRSRAEACELVEMLAPSGFHRLVLSRRRPLNPPWGEPARLLDWRPAITDFYLHRWPRRKGSWNRLRSLKLKSPSTNTLMVLCSPEWEVEILRQSDGKRSLRQILGRIRTSVPSESLCERVYQFYQAMLINLLPPRGAAGSSVAK